MTTAAIHYLFENLHKAVLHCLNSTKASSLPHARQAHAHLLKIGVSDDTVLATKLLSLYANHHCFTDANLVLSSISEPSLFSFSFLIYAFTKHNLFRQSLRLFSLMLSNGISPDSHLLPNVVKACAGLSAAKAGQQVHSIACVSGFGSDSIFQVSLLHMYAKLDRIRDAHKILDRLPERNVVTFGALLTGYARQGCVEKAEELLSEMRELDVEPSLVSWNGVIAGFNHSGKYSEAIAMFKRMLVEGCQPDDWTVSSVLPAIGEMEILAAGIQIHCYVTKQGLRKDSSVVTALIDMYGKCTSTLEMSLVFYEMQETDVGACNAFLSGLSRNGLVDNTLEMFRQFKSNGVELNVVSWTSIIACCSQHGKYIEALELFREMQIAGLKPNSVTIPCLLPACGNIAALQHGKAAHCFSLRRGFCDDVYVGSALVNMYAKCGRIELARLCFHRIPTKNLVCWNAIIDGYTMHGNAKEAMELLHLRLKEKAGG